MPRHLLTTLLALALLVACGSEEQTEQTGIEHAPIALDWPAMQAELAQHQGEPYLLNFWATWCAPCVAELPELIEVIEEHHEQGLKLVTINYDLMVPGVDPSEMLPKLVEFQAAKGLHAPVLVYDADDYVPIDEALQLPGPIPVTIAFDATGKEVARTEGATDADGFRKLARAALGQTTTP